MKTKTRRQFLATAAAASGGVALAPAAAAAPQALDARFERSADPAVTIAYPSSWYFYEAIVSDLIDPVQISTISTRPLSPAPGLQGFPNLSLFPPDAVVAFFTASLIVSGITFGNGPSITGGVSLNDFVGGGPGSSPDGFVTYAAAYQEPKWAWGIYILTGPSAKVDWPTTKAVVQSFTRTAS
jgi:hypothetical protein